LIPSMTDAMAEAVSKLKEEETPCLLVDENNANYVAVDGVLYSIDRKTLAQYPSGRPDKHYSVLNGTDSIQRLAFSSSNVKSVYLPTSLRRMGDLAFSYSNIERLVIDEGLEVIPPQAFYGCQVLQSIYLPSTITKIDDGAFYYTISVRDITIACSSEVPTLGNNAAFEGCLYCWVPVACLEDELDRVMVHGVLHLLGYDDHTPEDIAVMREKENYYVNMKRSLQQ